MADIITPTVAKGLSDKFYEKRKVAALEIERYNIIVPFAMQSWAIHGYSFVCAPFAGL